MLRRTALSHVTCELQCLYSMLILLSIRHSSKQEALIQDVTTLKDQIFMCKACKFVVQKRGSP